MILRTFGHIRDSKEWDLKRCRLFFKISKFTPYSVSWKVAWLFMKELLSNTGQLKSKQSKLLIIICWIGSLCFLWIQNWKGFDTKVIKLIKLFLHKRVPNYNSDNLLNWSFFIFSILCMKKAYLRWVYLWAFKIVG